MLKGFISGGLCTAKKILSYISTGLYSMIDTFLQAQSYAYNQKHSLLLRFFSSSQSYLLARPPSPQKCQKLSKYVFITYHFTPVRTPLRQQLCAGIVVAHLFSLIFPSSNSPILQSSDKHVRFAPDVCHRSQIHISQKLLANYMAVNSILYTKILGLIWSYYRK